jgi:uncharacterized protein (DUF1330 family)
MTAYVLCIREDKVRDPAAMEKYQRMNREGPRDPNLKPLVIYGATEALEGHAPDGMVLMHFPTVEDAKAWYNSLNYQAAIPFRKQAADYRVMIIQGM